MIGLCVVMAQLTIKMDQARRHGVTRVQVEQAIMSPALTGEDREIARSVAWYVYESNDDSGLSSRKLSQIVQRACEITQEDTVK